MPKSTAELKQRRARVGRSRLPGALSTSLSASPIPVEPGPALCRETHYAVPGAFPAVKQEKPATAWATQAAALIAWRDDRQYTVEEALARVGERWVQAYRAGTSLSPDDTAVFLATAGLCAAPPQSPSAEGWEAMLRTYGPLLVVRDGDDINFPTGGRIVLSISGDGTPSGTQLGYADSSTGSNGAEPLTGFAGPLRLVHWPADAGLACGDRPTISVTPTTSPEQRDSASAAVAASFRRRLARAAAVPNWDEPGNFPVEIRRFWANIGSRMHHKIWHAVRREFPSSEPGVMEAFKRMGFTPPPRLAGTRVRAAALGAGVDFLNMHRQMMQATRTLAAQLKLQYRPTAWSPIPWDPHDPVWPMPAWPGDVEPWKDPRNTVYFRGKVRDELEDARWLAGLSLDELGTTLEEGIHNWMHMHWAASPPSVADQQSVDPAADWLGDTFSSQVNPIFWKLHGWIDDCIVRWENAPVQAGTGPQRSSAPDLARYNWLGPMPSPTPSARSKSMEGHDHGGLSEAELKELAAGIDFSGHPDFPFADLSVPQLVARFGPVGETPENWLAEAEGRDPMSGMASLRGERRVVAGFERHGVRTLRSPARSRAFVDPVTAVEVGAAVFSAIQPLVSGGDFSHDTHIAHMYFPDTPPETPSLRTTVKLRFDADAAIYPTQYFWFKIQFDHNGYDLRNCRVDILPDNSATMIASKFHVTFAPDGAIRPGEREARIVYLISGRWNPKLGGDFSFEGELALTAKGRVTAQITRADDGRVRISSKDGLQGYHSDRLPAPWTITPFWPVTFSPPGSADISEDQMKALLAWFDGTNKDDLRGLASGRIKITVHGYASTKGKFKSNWELSQRRGDAVAQLVREALAAYGSTPNIVVVPHGERHAKTWDNVETEKERYAQVEYTNYVYP
jgi:outer membrane protein OmpA-like peptidoglycan-associated protein